MDKNHNTPVEDYGRKKGIRLVSLIIYMFLIYAVINGSVNFYTQKMEKMKIEKAKEEKLMQIEDQNFKVNLITVLDKNYKTSKEKYIEFDHDIKIPTPHNLISSSNILSYEEIIDTNDIAYRSPAVKIYYESKTEGSLDLLMDIFGEILENEYNYEKILYIFEDGKKIYTRKEIDGYFSYVILNTNNITYGVCYGKPELKTN